MKRKEKKVEKVDHPAHYGGDVTHEVYKCLEAWGLTRDAYSWNAVKYIARAGRKDGENPLIALKKACWYLEKRIKALELETVLRRAGPKFRAAWAEIEVVRDRIARGRCGRCGKKKCGSECVRYVPPEKGKKERGHVPR